MTLQEATKAAGIANAHIVDDSFDVVPGAGLPDAAIHTFLGELDAAQFDTVAETLGIPGQNEDAVVDRLRTQEGAAALFAKKASYGAPAELLFEEFTNVVGPERNLLTPLIDALRGIGITVHTFGRDYEPNGKPEPQMLFVDLKLREGAIRIEEPIAVVGKMRKAYQGAHPLVFLMSAQRGSLSAQRDRFRETAKLFSSQFEDLPKSKIGKADVLGRFLEHHVRAYPQIVTLQRHVESWDKAMLQAKDKLLETLRKLDLADYFVLGNTASADGAKLGSYVTDLLLEYLAQEIEGRPEVGAFAKELDRWNLKSLTRSRFNIEPVVADIFAANVLHSPNRLDWEKACGLGPSNGFLSLGDVFFPRAEINGATIKTAVVVLQPVCDLVRPEVVKERKATILMCHGNAALLTPSSVLETIDMLDPVILRYPATSQSRFVLEWDKKRAFHWDYTMLDTLQAPGADWIHVGRLRPLYALQLQRAVTADASRVGTQRRPFQYVPMGVQILAPKDGKWFVLFDRSTEASWGAISDDKSERKKTFILNDVLLRGVLEHLANWLGGNATQPAAQLLRNIMQCPEAIMALMYHVANTSEKEAIVYPLEAADLPEGMNALRKSVVFAVQREEDVHLSPSKAVNAEETAVMVFKFVDVVN